MVSSSHAAPKPKAVAGVPLPPRSRLQPDGTHISSRSYRNTASFYRRYLKRTRQAHRVIPSYKVRGTTVTRLQSTEPKSQWSTIHIFQTRGVTKIFVVAKPVVDQPAPPR